MNHVLYQYRKDKEGKLLELRVTWSATSWTFKSIMGGYMFTRSTFYNESKTRFMSTDDLAQKRGVAYKVTYKVLESLTDPDNEIPLPPSAVGKVEDLTDLSDLSS